MKRLLSSVILLAFASFILIRFNDFINIFIMPNFKDVRGYAEGLITVSTILMGFAFNVLGLLYTFDASKFVQKMQSTDYVIKRAKCIRNCLWVLGASSIASIILMVCNVYKFYKYVYIFSVLSLFIGFLLFAKSTYSLYELICNVHKYDRAKSQERYENHVKNRKNNRTENEKDDDTW